MGLQDELDLPYPIQYPGHEALMSIILTGTLLAKEGDRLLRPFGLTDTQFNVLMLLRYQTDRAISQSRLGDMLLVNRSNVTGLIDRMEQAGLVTRNAEPGDRRVKQIALTAAGRKLLDRAEKAYFGRLEEIIGPLRGADENRLCQVLERIRASLRGNVQA